MSLSLLRQLHPLKVHPVTKEIYLQLPEPHQSVIITPPRVSDAETIIKILNDPRVYKTLIGPPYPYRLEDAEAWLASIKRESDNVFETIRDAAEKGDRYESEIPSPVVVDGCLVRSLREVQEDGTDIFIGDITFRRCGRFDYLRDKERERELAERNASLPAGDPSIIWEIGDYLAGSHHGKGIMTAALRTLIHDWAVPHMHVRTISASTFLNNVGSMKVMQKNGFKMIDTVEDCVTIPESKGGGVVGTHFFEWTFTS